MNWISDNFGTLLVGALVLLALFFAARSVVKKRKQGGCVGCSGCDSADGCPHCTAEQTPQEQASAQTQQPPQAQCNCGCEDCGEKPL